MNRGDFSDKVSPPESMYFKQMDKKPLLTISNFII